MPLAYRIAKGPFSHALTRGLHWQLHGGEHMPKGAAVLVCNHASDADPAVLMRALPMPVGFLAAPFMGRLPVFRSVLRAAGSVAIGSTEPEPWRQQVQMLLLSGRKLVVFPEGQAWLLAQRFDAGLSPFHPGFAAFAYDARVPVVPLVIERISFEIVPFKTSPWVRRLSGNPLELTQTKRVLRYHECAVHVLPPIAPALFVERPKKEAVPWLVETARSHMEAKLAQLQRERLHPQAGSSVGHA